jgi:hypothetical protein
MASVAKTHDGAFAQYEAMDPRGPESPEEFRCRIRRIPWWRRGREQEVDLWGARPPAMDLFLWGGLSTRVRELLFRPNFDSKLTGSLVLVAILGMLYFSCSMAFQGWTDVLKILVVDIVCFRVATLMGPLLGGFAAGYCGTLGFADCGDPATESLPALVQALRNEADDLTPYFQERGWHIEYVSGSDEITNSFASLAAFHYSYFRVSRTSAQKVGDDEASLPYQVVAEGKPDPPNFRVALYGSPVWSPLRSLLVRRNDREYTFLPGRPEKLRTPVDTFTWGAVAAELVPVTEDYMHCRMAGLLLTVFASQLLLLHSPPFWRILVVVSAGALMYELAVPSVERICLRLFLYGGRDPLACLEERTARVAPLVARRSGYRIEYRQKRDGAVPFLPPHAYVHFAPEPGEA